eukprot:XP_011670342.1 PREDICTED: LOW QUALITY PROTEIN: three prime repair exonuclease 2-like [Strongylocentrotus purpuratus]
MDSAVAITINSFVFLDLETSHLESCERPKIIEMSLFAVHRTGLLHPAVGKTEDATYDLSKVSLPRVVDKLTLCFDPRKQTSPETFGLTGLDNYNLGESKKMSLDKDIISMLNIFLKRQEGPVCLVAHNGKRFDFPMLRTELSRLTAEELFEDLFCADSLEGFTSNFATETEEPISLKRKLPTTGNNPSTSSDNTPERTLTKRPSPPPPPRKTNQEYHTKSPKISYSLINIFERTFGREPPNFHCAEDDVASLIKVLLPRVEEFVNWADVHAVQYKDIGLYYKP